MTMLDGFGPLQILSFVEQFNTFTFAQSKQRLASDSGTLLTLNYDLEPCPPLDILVMPGGGVTAGIDFALTLIAEVVGPPAAQAMQLAFEYRPQPPFDAGSPDTAPPEILETVQGLLSQQNQDLDKFIEAKPAA